MVPLVPEVSGAWLAAACLVRCSVLVLGEQEQEQELVQVQALVDLHFLETFGCFYPNQKSY